jgi:DNA replication protein DnaC
MTEELEQLLKNLKLRRMLSVYDEQLRAAEKSQASYSEFVAGLLRAQWHERQDSALEWRIRRANLPERWSLESFPWARQPGVNRKSDACLRRTRLRCQTRKPGAGGADRQG